MAVLTGFKQYASSLIQAEDHLHIVPQIDVFGDFLYEDRQASQLETLVDSGITRNYPVVRAIQSRNGVYVTSFGDDWYNTIHLLPSRIDVGAMASAQERHVVVWSSYLTTQTLSSIVGAGDEGISYSGLSAPATILPLRLSDFVVDISTNGPSTIDASYTFAFIGDTAVLSIVGLRISVFGFKPTWGENFLERYEWKTDLLRTYDGNEQRISVRPYPRKRVEFDILLNAAEAAAFDAVLTGSQSRRFAVPVWQDRARLTDPLTAGTSVIYLDTVYKDFYVGGDIAIGTSWAATEAAQVAAVYPDRIELVRPLLGSWPIGSWVAPARVARLESKQQVSRPTADVVIGRLVFVVQDMVDLGAVDSAILYDGIPVLLDKPNDVQDAEVTYTRLQSDFDADTQAVWVDDRADRPFHMRKWHYTLETRAKISSMVKWLAARSGRRVAYWQPIYELGIVPAATIQYDGFAIVVEYRGYEKAFTTLGGRSDVLIKTVSGSIYFAHITSVIAGSVPGTEELLIETAIGVTLTVSQIENIWWLELHRLDTDAIEVSWHTDSVADTEFMTVGVIA